VDLPLPVALPDYLTAAMHNAQEQPASPNHDDSPIGTVPYVAPHDPAHSGLGHVVPVWLLAAVFTALIALTVLTVAASKVDLGNFNLYIALAIAATKASLVVMFFMHLYWDRPFNSMVFVGCLLFVTLFIGITLTDSKANASSDFPGESYGMKHKPLGSP
jgi:cytochrome c oxidase subunit 4